MPTLYIRQGKCTKTDELKRALSDADWAVVKVEYVSSTDPFLKENDIIITDLSQIVQRIQALSKATPTVKEQFTNAKDAAVRAYNAIQEHGTAAAPMDMVMYRRSLCMQCPFGVRKLFLYKCSQCGCHIKTKTSLLTEFCPIGKW